MNANRNKPRREETFAAALFCLHRLSAKSCGNIMAKGNYLRSDFSHKKLNRKINEHTLHKKNL